MKRGPGLVFVLFSLIFLAVGWALAVSQGKALHSHRAVDARVIDKGIDEKTDGDRGTTYTPWVRYEYVVDGRTYRSNRITPLDISAGREWAQETIDRFDVGGIATAYYDPADPAQTYLIREASFLPYVFVLFPMIFTCLGLGTIFHRKATPLPCQRSCGTLRASRRRGTTSPSAGKWT